jgi:hypothetical protein
LLNEAIEVIAFLESKLEVLEVQKFEKEIELKIKDLEQLEQESLGLIEKVDKKNELLESLKRKHEQNQAEKELYLTEIKQVSLRNDHLHADIDKIKEKIKQSNEVVKQREEELKIKTLLQKENAQLEKNKGILLKLLNEISSHIPSMNNSINISVNCKSSKLSNLNESNKVLEKLSLIESDLFSQNSNLKSDLEFWKKSQNYHQKELIESEQANNSQLKNKCYSMTLHTLMSITQDQAKIIKQLLLKQSELQEEEQQK